MRVNRKTLELLRKADEQEMPDSCSIFREVLSQDSFGGHTITTVDLGQYRCRFSVTSGKDIELAARLTSETTWTIELPYGATISPGDWIHLNGRELRVIYLVEGSWRINTKVLAVEYSRTIQV